MRGPLLVMACKDAGNNAPAAAVVAKPRKSLRVIRFSQNDDFIEGIRLQILTLALNRMLKESILGFICLQSIRSR